MVYPPGNCYFRIGCPLFTFQKIESVDNLDVSDEQSGLIVGYIGKVPVLFLIDSGAEVNTINVEVFNTLMNDEDSKKMIFHVLEGSDRPLRAYASAGNIDVSASFVAELLISEDRPCLMEKFYVIANARSLLSRGTAIRYSYFAIVIFITGMLIHFGIFV